MKKRQLPSMPEEIKALNLNEIISEGLSILNLIAVTFVNNKLATGLRNEFEACETHKRYIIWHDDLKRWARGNIKDFLEQAYFFEADSVPLMKSGIEYGFSNSPESIELMNNIKQEIKTKLDKLRGLSKTNDFSTTLFQKVQGRDLLLGSHTICLSDKSNESDALRLIKTLEKDPQREWEKYDILIDWGMNEDDIKKAPDLKLYNAANSLQTRIASKTLIHDFLIFTKLTAQISPKYLAKIEK